MITDWKTPSGLAPRQIIRGFDGRAFVHPGELSGSLDKQGNQTEGQTVRIFNVCQDTDRVHALFPDGGLSEVYESNLRLASGMGFIPGSEYWQGNIDKLKAIGGVLVEISCTNGRKLYGQDPRQAQIFEALRPEDLNEIREGIVMRTRDNGFCYYVFVSESELKRHKSGIFVPQAGITLGLYRALIKNKLYSMAGMDTNDSIGVGGFRIAVSTTVDAYPNLYMNLAGNQVHISTTQEDNGEDMDYAYIYYTGSLKGEVLLEKMPLEEALAGKTIDSEYGKFNVKLYRNKQDAINDSESSQQEVERLKVEAQKKDVQIKSMEQEIKKLEKQKKEAKNEAGQTIFGKIATGIANLVAPVIKLVLVVVGLFAAA
jgi:hypothetical protein